MLPVAVHFTLAGAAADPVNAQVTVVAAPSVVEPVAAIADKVVFNRSR